MNLLEKAQSYGVATKAKPKIKITAQEVRLAVEMIHGRITVRAYAYAIGSKNPGTATHRIPTVLRYGLRKGLIKIKVI